MQRRRKRIGRARSGQYPLQNGLRVEGIKAPDGEELVPVTAVASMPHVRYRSVRKNEVSMYTHM